MQQFPREIRKLTEAKQVAFTRGPAPIVLIAALFPCPLNEWDPWHTPQEQVWFKTEGEIFYQKDGGSLLMAALTYLRC
jgi:hypothetical protein